MSQEIVKNQYIIALRNGMIAYIVADKIEDIAGALQNNKFFNTKEQMMINTADIVAIMAPSEWSNQQKYQRGWYVGNQGTKWYDKKGEYQEETDLGELRIKAQERCKEIAEMTDPVEKKEAAIKFIAKVKERGLLNLIYGKTFDDLLSEYGK